MSFPIPQILPDPLQLPTYPACSLSTLPQKIKIKTNTKSIRKNKHTTEIQLPQHRRRSASASCDARLQPRLKTLIPRGHSETLQELSEIHLAVTKDWGEGALTSGELGEGAAHLKVFSLKLGKCSDQTHTFTPLLC